MRLNDHENTAQDYQRARQLRNNASPIERKLWRVLRVNAAAHGLKFRRQQTIHPYIVDFACMAAKLVIELDGTSHDNQQSYDAQRTQFLQTQGYHVLRFTNADVMRNAEGVVAMILDYVRQQLDLNSRESATKC